MFVIVKLTAYSMESLCFLIMSTCPSKRPKTNHYHDRIHLEDNIEVVHSHSYHLTSWNIPSGTACSLQKGWTTWAVGSAWAPEDNQELVLDESGDWFDEEMTAEVFNSGPSCVKGPPKKKYRQSRVSVCSSSLLCALTLTYLSRQGLMYSGKISTVLSIWMKTFNGMAVAISRRMAVAQTVCPKSTSPLAWLNIIA